MIPHDPSLATRDSALAARIVLILVAGIDYRYELRRGEELVATGHLNYEQPLEVGDRIEIGGRHGIVSAIEPVLRERELRLVVQLLRDHSE